MKVWNGHFWPNRPFLTKQAIFVAILAKESIFQQTAPCGYSRLVSGDDWHHENLIRSFRSSNFEKTLKIWSKYWWLHIFKRFLNSGRLDSTDFCYISSDISRQAYRAPTRHTLLKLWNGHFWPNGLFLTKQTIFVNCVIKINQFVIHGVSHLLTQV